MPNLFNFYQGGPFGTGYYYPITFLDFFTGTYFPPSLEAGKTIGFLWEGMGRRTVEQTISLSGAPYDSNKEESTLRLGFFGYSSPLVTESGQTTFRFSGAYPQDNMGKMVFPLSFKGSGIRDNIDFGILKLNFTSGVYTQDNHDVGTFTHPINSGVISQDNLEPVSFTTAIRGNLFAKRSPDYASVNMRISSISYSTAPYRTIVSSGTGMAIQFRLANVFYSTAV